jgi:hypothetical protein
MKKLKKAPIEYISLKILYLKPVFGVCGVRDGPDASIGVDERVLTTNDVAVARLSVSLLVARHGIADTVVVRKIGAGRLFNVDLFYRNKNRFNRVGMVKRVRSWNCMNGLRSFMEIGKRWGWMDWVWSIMEIGQCWQRAESWERCRVWRRRWNSGDCMNGRVGSGNSLSRVVEW